MFFYPIHRVRIRSSYYILPVLLFSVIYNLPRFFEWRTVTEVTEVPCYYVEPTPQSAGALADALNASASTARALTEEELNCTQLVHNVTLIARSLRQSPIYIAVSVRWVIFVCNL